MFDVGKDCVISEKWIPEGEDTGMDDITGVRLRTRDKVKLTGCKSQYAYIGYNTDMTLMLFFGSDHGSVGWDLDIPTIKKHKIQVI